MRLQKQFSACLAAVALAAAAGVRAPGAVDNPYLIGFTFQGGYSFDKLMPEEQLQVFNEGALDGWGLIYVWNYNPEPGTPPAELADTIAWLKAGLKPGKHIWPTVSLSRIIQPAPGYLQEITRFHEIQGMDLANEAGVRAIFEREWRNACLLAKELGSPGILFDPECYGNTAVSDPAKLARMRNQDVAATIAECRAFGARLVDITEEVYPSCHIVTMFTGLYMRPEHWSTTAYIHLGIMQRAKDLGSRQMLIDGGELGVGYLHTSFSALQERIFNRWLETRDLLAEYPNYELGGVLAPYVKRAERTYWATENRIGPEQTAEDFVPHFRELFRNYRFTWLYGTHHQGKTGFNPWGARHSAVMSAALERARRTSRYAPPDLDGLPRAKVPEGDRAWAAQRLTQRPRQVLVNWAEPGTTRVIRKYFRGQAEAPEAAAIVPGPHETGGRTWHARIDFDKTLLSRWPWPGVTALALPGQEINADEAVWTEVYNAGDTPIHVRLATFQPGEKVVVADSYGGYTAGHNVYPGESRVLFCRDLNGPIEAISLAAVAQPRERMSIHVSPVYLAGSGDPP